MKILFFVILFFHGVIHFLGFAKAFNLKEIKELTLPISQFNGVIWLIAGILFLTSGLLFTFNNNYWWLPAVIGIIISQFLIFTFWKDAKFGSIPNIIVLLVAMVGYANFSFQNMVGLEVKKLLSDIKLDNQIVDPNMISNLPVAVQSWLNYSGIVGKPFIHSVSLNQKVQMKMKSDQTEWYDAEAAQYFNVNSSSFIWSVKMEMMTLFQVVGRDKLINGKGEMLIKLLGLLSLVDTKDNSKLNMGSAQRYLAEIVWFPSAALSKNIKWQAIDDSTASAVISINETTAEGTFYFNSNGSFKNFITMRYFGGEENSELREWIITPSEIKEMNGIKIPTKSTATWKLENGDWDWLKVEIEEINYNNLDN
ncbi:MAG: hypothetical protein H6612_02375 [Ignavibacteriales bacterium]|nr:hypothetical protein [Ignavibacteriales bacterium]MCB9258172.1 hypothetical protein [Ignavibacteriales bacterium]